MGYLLNPLHKLVSETIYNIGRHKTHNKLLTLSFHIDEFLALNRVNCYKAASETDLLAVIKLRLSDFFDWMIFWMRKLYFFFALSIFYLVIKLILTYMCCVIVRFNLTFC